MTLGRIIVVALTVVGLVCAPVLAGDTTFHGEVSTDWHNPSNWTFGVPGSGDTAHIQTGKTAIISSQNAACLDLDMQGTAIVHVKSRDLTIHGGDVGLGSGTLKFAKTDTARPQLLYYGNLTITGVTGAGTLDASAGSSLGPADIKNASGQTGGLELDSGTLKGSFSVDVQGDLRIDGVCLVDDADDEMVLGLLTAGGERCKIKGTGAFVMDAGTIKIGRILFPTEQAGHMWEGDLQVSGASSVFHISQYMTGGDWANTDPVSVTDGATLIVDAYWRSDNGGTFNNCTVDAAEGVQVSFGFGVTAWGFTWTGQGNYNSWTNCSNWDPPNNPPECYPSASNQKVLFPYTANGWGQVLLDFTSESVYNVTAKSDVDFTGDGAAATLDLKGFQVGPSDSGRAVVTISSSATIVVTQP